MGNKEEGYYYSYRLFKSVKEHNTKKLEILNEIANHAIEANLQEYIINTCLSVIKVCDYLSKRMTIIEDLRRADDQVNKEKIALADSEVKEIKEISLEIEELEFELSRHNLSPSFH